MLTALRQVEIELYYVPWHFSNDMIFVKPGSIKIIFASFCLLLLSNNFSILDAQPLIESVHQLSYNEGLSDRAVRDIVRDQKGFLWIATDNGLNRYINNGFEVFDIHPNSRFQINENRINELVELRGNRLAMFNKRKEPSFEILDLESFQSQLIPLNATTGVFGTLKAVTGQYKGDVFAVSDSTGFYELFQLNLKNNFERLGSIIIPQKKAAGEVRIIQTQSGIYWLLDSNNGLLKISPSGKLLHFYPLEHIEELTTRSQNAYVTSLLYEDKKGRLWVSFPFRNGLLKIAAGDSELQLATDFPTNTLYSEIWEDDKGQLLIGSFRVFGLIDRLFMLRDDDKPIESNWILEVDDKINSIFGNDFDRQLFLGTIAGIYRIDLAQRPISWKLAERQLRDDEWSDGISIRSITGDDDGNIYISRELKAWYRMNQGNGMVEQIHLKDPDGKPMRLWCNSNIVYDPAGYLWGGSCTDDRYGIMHRYNLKTGIAHSFPIDNKIIQHIILGRHGGLILVAGAEEESGRLLFFDTESETFSPYDDLDGSNPLEGRKPQFVHESRTGHIWIGTNEGLLKVDRTNRKTEFFDRKSKMLTNDNILVIHEVENGDLWLGTHGGLIILNPITLQTKTYDRSKGLCNNTVCGILPDGEGHFWLSTFYGLSFFDPVTKLFSNFYKEKGLTFNEFNRLAFYKDHKNRFYFGTLNGINIFKNEEFRQNLPTNYPLQWIGISKYKNDGNHQFQFNNLTNPEKLTLSQNDDYIRLDFALPSYVDPAKNQYAIKMEGIDTSWQYLGNTAFREINRPPPGNYKIKIKANPANDFWLDKELEMELRVKLAFYQTTWFQIALPLFILLISYLIGMWNVKRIKRKQEEQTRINKKFAELELQALQSQMNPHFVFNSLGAIQYFIQKNDAGTADNYLAKFAKLMRLFLESSKNKYISLSEEIKLLSLYVELEQMRFEDKFKANIVVDENLDIHSREVPSILIQPFVENSINHGLFHKKGKGYLDIRFFENKEKALICQIEDNGIGRKLAESLKKKSPKNYKSRGMQIVNERLEVLQEVDEIKITVNVEDLHPGGLETGTIVNIEIPDLD